MQVKQILGLLAASAAMVVAEGDSQVEVLTKDNFDEFVASNDLVLAEFYAPWCGHCKSLAPEYEEAATTLAEKGIKLGKVDCTEQSELCSSFGVEGYPTLKVFRGKENVTPYGGQRKAAAITSYMIKQSLPAVSPVTAESLAEFKTADKVVLVAYYAADDKASAEVYGKVADELRETYLFGASTDAALAEAEEVVQPSIVLYKQFDEGRTSYSGDKFDAEAIEKFAKAGATPLIGEVGPETYSGYMAAGLPLAYIFAETPEEREALSATLKPVAEKHRGVINFATIDAKAFGAHAGNLNLNADKFPAFAIQEVAKNQKFPFDQETELTHDAVAAFVAEFAEGKLSPSIKSEPIPESNDGPVTTIVAHNYDAVVLDDTKDVLVEFYAPWCGHCKSLAPKYEELGELFAASEFKDKVVIAKVDATANDVPDEIQGFPTIKLFPAGAKDAPVTYSGARTVEDLLKFIAESGKYQAVVAPAPAAEEPVVEEAAEAAPEAATEEKKEEPSQETAEVHDEL